MTDDKTPDDFYQYLVSNTFSVTRGSTTDGKIFFVVADYEIPYGQNQGKKVTVAFPIPLDYPTTAPYGMHIKIPHNLEGNISSIGASPLGPDWQFWSRKVNSWDVGNRNARVYLEYVNRWLEVS
jgi:hypothetical protein